MTQNARTPGSLNELEQLGALSARLTHALSNHLAIITGNLFLAANLKESDKLPQMLQAALQASNEAGALLSRFAEMRRAARIQSGALSLTELAEHLRGWAQARAWTFEPPSANSLNPSGLIRGKWEWLAFALDSVATHTGAREGTLFLSVISGTPSHPLAEIKLHCSSEIPLDWQNVREDFRAWNLLATQELLTQMRITHESRSLSPQIQETRLRLHLFQEDNL